MNVGQVLETHLGVAAKALGFKVATPVFDGIREKQIREYLHDATKKRGLHLGEGKRESAALRWTHWRIRRSGSGGWLHLHDETRHLVADKIHARAVGPYSLVLSSRLVAKRNMVANALVRWRSGLLRLRGRLHFARVADC